MKKIRIFVLLLAAAVLGLGTVAASGAPRAVVDEKNHDFGTAYAGDDVFHTFVIENPGDAELLIKSVRTG
ncbi:MAG: DUF1573 domain-containing protein [Desulfobacteraceae bacterium]|nr:DUF1573 domain-containing protein [Desulfobacteraceae bacterium]